jgi:holo-[acyl-carrier protein] synthase
MRIRGAGARSCAQKRRSTAHRFVMIIGIGSDVIDIRRIERTLNRFGERFTSRVFTDIERSKSDRRLERAASYAKRFAAKEACSKALGTGFAKGVYWRDLGVVNEPSGKPTMVLSGEARRHLDRLVPDGHRPVVHLTVTDEYPYAHAHVIIYAIKA